MLFRPRVAGKRAAEGAVVVWGRKNERGLFITQLFYCKASSEVVKF